MHFCLRCRDFRMMKELLLLQLTNRLDTLDEALLDLAALIDSIEIGLPNKC